MSKLLRPARVLLLGPPGSGKGTQTSRLLKRFGIPGISSGDLLRQQIENKTEIGEFFFAIISNFGLYHETTCQSRRAYQDVRHQQLSKKGNFCRTTS